MERNVLSYALLVFALVAGLVKAQPSSNPLALANQPLEGLQEKSNAAIDFIQGENAELAGAAFRLRSIVAAPNATVPEKLSTLANSTRSAFDAAWARARSLGLKPQQTAAIYGELLSQYKCVTTPAQFVAAFRENAKALALSHCVSDDLVARLQSGADAGQALSRLRSGTAGKTLNFFSGADALAKYLVVSFPQTLGDNIPQFDNSYFNQNYSSAGFAGLRQFRNGQGLVNNIGFGAPDWSSTDAYVLGVYSKAAIRAAMRSDNEFYQKYNLTASTVGIRPFWQTIKDATEITYAAYDLQIPQVAIDLIANTTFADLTGCGAQCSFAQSVGAPSACFPNLVYAGKRNGTEQCLDPSFAGKPRGFDEGACGAWNQTTGWTLVPPTEIDAFSPPCSADFLGYQKALGAAVPSPPTFTLADSVKVALKYKELLATTTTDLQRALLTRSFYLQSSQGTFNPLFTGNGFTATGVGGVFMATSSEFLFSPFNSTLLEEGKGYETVPLCLNGYMPSAAGTCTQLTPPKP